MWLSFYRNTEGDARKCFRIIMNDNPDYDMSKIKSSSFDFFLSSLPQDCTDINT